MLTAMTCINAVSNQYACPLGWHQQVAGMHAACCAVGSKHAGQLDRVCACMLGGTAASDWANCTAQPHRQAAPAGHAPRRTFVMLRMPAACGDDNWMEVRTRALTVVVDAVAERRVLHGAEGVVASRGGTVARHGQWRAAFGGPHSQHHPCTSRASQASTRCNAELEQLSDQRHWQAVTYQRCTQMPLQCFDQPLAMSRPC